MTGKGFSIVVVRRAAFTMLAGLLLAGCGSATAQRRYTMKGIVRGVDRDSRLVLVDHEAIPGYMGAMTMTYSVPDLKLILSLKPGDHIEATVIVKDRHAWLEEIRVTQHVSLSGRSQAPGANSKVAQRGLASRGE